MVIWYVEFVPMKKSITPKSDERHNGGVYETDEERWQAVVNRDSGADGKFFYSVRTTGVYCRPSCASRRARQGNVEFHDTCDAAVRAGFRPCKRCRPDTSIDPVALKVEAACRLIESADEAPNLTVLSAAADMSVYHFQRVFTRLTGMSPKAYEKAHRADRVRNLLLKEGSVTEAIYEAGYGSSGRFYADSSRVLGMTPKRFRDGGVNETIRFAVGECSLGAILVASSDAGVCAISLGDDCEALVRELQDRFHKAELIGGDRAFEKTVAEVIGFVEAPDFGMSLPLDLRGTAFQRRVWQALVEIPPGRTVSYSEIARDLGAPKSSRAVAGACAANSIAVAIPCHRVVRTNGELSGYRWGVDRKRELLKREGGSSEA